MDSKQHISPFLFEYKWGYRDNEENVLVEPLWDYADNFYEGFAIVRNENGLYGFLNSDGQMALECQYEEAMKFIDGVALVKTKDGNWEHINCKGEILHNCPWIDVYPYSEGLAAVQKPTNDIDQICGISARYGFINEERELVIPCNYSQVSSFRDGYARVTDVYGNSGFINKEGEFTWIYDEKSSNYVANEKALPEEYTIPPKWNFGYSSQVQSFSEGLNAVRGKNNRWGFIDQKGKIQIPLRWMEARSFHEGYAAVKGLNGRYGFIDYRGNLICKLRWASVADFHEGMACVYDANLEKYGFLNSSGELQIPCKYDSGDDFHEGVAYVKLNGKEIPIDECGDRIEAEHDKPIDSENSSYEKYCGSYAQDEMGYSDDDIDTIFDGDPNAYWNID